MIPDTTANPTPETSQVAANGEQRRRELTVIAYTLIAQKGFEGLRVREVANRAGINIATLHYYFPTKEVLVQAVVQYLTEQFATTGAGYQAKFEEAKPLELLRQEFTRLSYRLEQLPELFVVAAELELRALRDPVITPILDQMYQAWQSHLVVILQNGVKAGVFRSDLDTPASATAILSLMKGFSYHPGNEPAKQVAKLAKQVENWLTFSSSEKKQD